MIIKKKKKLKLPTRFIIKATKNIKFSVIPCKLVFTQLFNHTQLFHL